MGFYETADKCVTAMGRIARSRPASGLSRFAAPRVRDRGMYASDYPHGESHFPESAGLVIGWDMAEERKRKLLWDNAVRFYARAKVD